MERVGVLLVFIDEALLLFAHLPLHEHSFYHLVSALRLHF